MELQQVGTHHRSVQRVIAVQRNSAPNPERLLLAEGLWAHDLLLSADTPIHTFFWCPEAAPSREAHQRAEQIVSRAATSYRVSPKTLARITERDKPDGLVSLAALPRWDPEGLSLRQDALVLVADSMEIPGNLGTLIRTLDACAADCLILTQRRTRLTHPKVFRASQGMVLRVPVLDFASVAEAQAWLRRHCFSVYLADTDDARNYRTLDFARERTAFVLGSEKYGIPREWSGPGVQRAFVPMLGSVDSLNVAIAAAVLLFEARAQKAGWSNAQPGVPSVPGLAGEIPSQEARSEGAR